MNRFRWLLAVFLSLAFILLVVLYGYFVYAPQKLKSILVKKISDNTTYQLSIGDCHLRGLTTIILNDVSLKPKQTKTHFVQSSKYETDWITVKANEIQLNQIGAMDYIRHNKLTIKQTSFRKPIIYVYRDKRIADSPFKKKLLPASLIRSINNAVTFNTLSWEDGHISYEEWPAKGPGSITITFGEISMTAKHLSTDSSYYKSHPTVFISGKTLVMDSVNADFEYSFSVLNRKDEFTFKGKIASFPASLLNPLIQPLTNVRIKSGNINKIAFGFEADDDAARGQLNMDYSGLTLEVLTKETHEPSKIKSFISNLFIRKNTSEQAPSSSKNGIGKIYSEREKNRFLFNYWWKAIKSGITDVVSRLDVEKIEKLKKNKKKPQ